MGCRIPKVAWKTCCMHKTRGGLGILDLERMSCKMAAKWIVRSLSSNDFWAFLIRRHTDKFFVQNYKA